LEDQLNMYHQQWQADQQKQIIAKMSGKMPGESNNGKRKNNERKQHKTNGGRSGGHQGNNGRGGRGRCRGGREGKRRNNSDHLKKMNVSIVAKKVTFIPASHHQERMTMIIQTWYPSRIWT
jgi:hypothetical protein